MLRLLVLQNNPLIIKLIAQHPSICYCIMAVSAFQCLSALNREVTYCTSSWQCDFHSPVRKESLWKCVGTSSSVWWFSVKDLFVCAPNTFRITWLLQWAHVVGALVSSKLWRCGGIKCNCRIWFEKTHWAKIIQQTNTTTQGKNLCVPTHRDVVSTCRYDLKCESGLEVTEAFLSQKREASCLRKLVLRHWSLNLLSVGALNQDGIRSSWWTECEQSNTCDLLDLQGAVHGPWLFFIKYKWWKMKKIFVITHTWCVCGEFICKWYLKLTLT